MIIYGSKMYGTKNVVWGFGVCNHCGAYTKHRSYNGKKFGHIYFIPLILMGGAVRVMRECGSCKMGQHMPESAVGEMIGRIESLMGACVAATEAGGHTFSDGESPEPIDTDAFLLEAVEMMYVAGHAGDVPEVLAMFDTDASRYEHALGMGVFEEISSGGSGAIAHFERAMEAEPDRLLPILLASDLAANTGDPARALDYLHRAERLKPDSLQVLIAQLGPLERLQEWDTFCAVFDRCAAMEPGLLKEKKLAKLRKKYGKKAGV